ncbi:MAG: sulfotransferase family protein [Candidatus Wenzhouxiangella sp. M2_3B_020]
MTRKGSPQLEVARLVGELRDGQCLIDRFRSVEESESETDFLEPGAAGTCLREPIRLVHHFACTGGTLLCKGIASMPNVQLLSEVDPLDAQRRSAPGRFAPTDLISLVRLGTVAVPERLLQAVFLGGLEPIREYAEKAGLRLVLRDHSHGHFCFGSLEDRPTLREIVAEQAETCSILWVRHPLESFMSLRHNGWLHFEPPTLDEYARRYNAFLDRHTGTPRFQYESFVRNPRQSMKEICRAFEIPFRETFERTIAAHRLSGDSGRTGTTIAPRPLRPIAEEVEQEARASRNFLELCGRLGYSDCIPADERGQNQKKSNDYDA